MKLGGLFWSLVREVSVQGGSIFTLLALALFLSPREFGIVAIAAVWLNLLGIFSDLGFAAAVVQRKLLDEAHLSSVFVLNVGLGIALCVVGWITSLLMTNVLPDPELMHIMPYLALSVLFTAISATPQALARKQLNFKALAIRDSFAVLVSALVAIAMAYGGFGLWAFVAQVLVRAVLGALLVWFMVAWRPRLSAFRWAAVRELWGFSSALVVHSILKWALQSVDKIFLAYLFGATQLGYYAFGERSIMAPATSIRTAAGSYFFPIYSAAQDDIEALRKHYLISIRLLVYALFPAVTLFILTAPNLIPMVFGVQWANAVPISQLFALAVYAQVLMSPAGELMKALNKPRWLIWWTMSLTAFQWSAMLAGASLGLEGVVAGIVLANFVFVGIIVWITRRLVSVGYGELIRAMIPGSLISVAILCVWLLLHLLGVGTIPALVTLLLASLAIGMAVVWKFQPNFCRKLLQLATSVLRHR